MPQLQPVRPITVFQAVFDQLSSLLASDAFAPGDRLPSERELAEQLQVSRPSVREALKSLRVLGLIEVRGRSTYVQGARRAAAPVLTLSLAEAELLEIHEFREAIETQIAELAAERAAVRDTEELDRIFATMQQEFTRDVDAFLEAERAFHRVLAQAAGNRLLFAAHAQIHDHDLVQPHLHLRPATLYAAELEGTMDHTLAAYHQIFEAVRQRDGAKARRVMRAHLEHLREYIIVGAFGHPSTDGQASSSSA